MKYTWFITDSGKKVKTAQFNGYAVGEKILEDLMFQVTIQSDNTLKVWVKPEDDAYFNTLNTNKYLNDALKYATENDIFQDPISKEDCWFETNSKIDVVSSNLQKVSPQRIAKEPGIPKVIQDIMAKADNVYVVGEGGGSMTLGVNGMGNFELEADIEDKPKDYGKYKTNKIKLLDFVAHLGNSNVLSKEATIDGKFFNSLALEGIKFKMTLKDDSSFDFEEVGTNKCSEEEIARYVTQFDGGSISNYSNKSVLNEYKFIANHTVKEREIVLESFLSCEGQKPIDALRDIIFEEEPKPVEINEEQSNKIMSLLFDDESEAPSNEPPIPVITEKEVRKLSHTEQMFYNQFEEKKIAKKEELTKTLNNILNERKVAQNNLTVAELKINECNSEIDLLNSRIESMEIKEPLNGYFIYIPEAITSKTVLDAETKELLSNRLALQRNINVAAFIKLFDNSIYQIRVGLEVDGELVELKDFKNITPLLKKYNNWGGKFYIEEENLYFEGNIDWSTLNNKLVKNGFLNEHTFEEFIIKEEEKKKEVVQELINVYHNLQKNEEERDFVEEQIEHIEKDLGCSITGFIFAVSENCLITITPAEFYEKKGCVYEENILAILHKKLPSSINLNFDELSEGNLVLVHENDIDIEDDIEVIVKTLLSNGFIFNREFQKFISPENFSLVNYLVNSK